MTSSDFQLRGVGDPRLAVHATSQLASWLWSIDGTRVLWANPVGAKLFGAAHAMRCAMEFLGLEHMMFGSDMPFDPERGTAFIRWTMENIDELGLNPQQLEDLYQNNAARILGVKI